MVHNKQQIINKLKSFAITLDHKNFDRIFPNDFIGSKIATVYVEEKDSFAFDYYTKLIEEYNLNLYVSYMPINPDESFVKFVEDKPGYVASVLINDENGVSAMPYISTQKESYALNSYNSYFYVLGLLAANEMTLAKQILGNITYQIGHVYNLKPTNLSKDQASPSKPIYTSIVKEIAKKIETEEERRTFLTIHIKRSILDYQRQWGQGKTKNGLFVNQDNRVLLENQAMLYQTELDIAHFIEAHTENQMVDIDGTSYIAESWRQKAIQRKSAIMELLWGEESKSFYDYDVSTNGLDIDSGSKNHFAIWSGIWNPNGIHEILENSRNLSLTDQILLWKGLSSKKTIEYLNVISHEFSEQFEMKKSDPIFLAAYLCTLV